MVVHGLRRARLRGGERVAVIGGGIDRPVLGGGRARGRRATSISSARHDAQRAAGARLGAGEPSGTYDLVIDAAGTKSALEAALPLCRPGARSLAPSRPTGVSLSCPVSRSV